MRMEGGKLILGPRDCQGKIPWDKIRKELKRRKEAGLVPPKALSIPTYIFYGSKNKKVRAVMEKLRTKLLDKFLDKPLTPKLITKAKELTKKVLNREMA